MIKLHCLDNETGAMVVFECESSQLYDALRSIDSERYNLRYMEDTAPIEPLVTFTPYGY